MWIPAIVCAVFFSLIAAGAWRWPEGTRLFLGFFFIVCGLGINAVFTILSPEAYVVGRMWDRSTKKHLHINGCQNCRKVP